MCKNKTELNDLVAKRRKLSALKKKIDEQIKNIDHDIIEYVVAKGELGGKDNNSLIVFGDGYKVSYITVIQHPLDSDKVKEFLGDQLPEFQTVKTSTKLDIR
jgi:hypothetical protein